ncbi:MAG: patatin-like phospholipase family protein [Spirochaetota bacterium]
MERIKNIKEKLSGMANRYETCLAISGGGCKAMYGLGVGYKLRKWGIKFKEISGVSAGAAMILGILSETEEDCIEYIEELCRRNESNFAITNLLKGERPFPHENIYRRTIRYGLDQNKILHSGVKVHILTVQAIPKETSMLGVWNKARFISQTYQAYMQDEANREKGLAANRVSEMMEKWNMKEVIYTNEDLKNPSVIEQIILNSSSVPPVVSFQKDDNVYYLDGGLTNNLLLEPFPKESKKIGVHYEDVTLVGKEKELLDSTYLIRPSKKLPIKIFDYTNHVGIRDAYELGKDDAERQKEQILQYCKRKLVEEFKTQYLGNDSR